MMKYLNTKHIKTQRKPIRQLKLENRNPPLKQDPAPIPLMHDPLPHGYCCSFMYFPW